MRVRWGSQRKLQHGAKAASCDAQMWNSGGDLREWLRSRLTRANVNYTFATRKFWQTAREKYDKAARSTSRKELLPMRRSL